MRKVLKVITALGLGAVAGASLTSCQKQYKDYYKDINLNMVEKLNQSEVAQTEKSAKYQDFKLLGADISEANEYVYEIEVHGIASYSANGSVKDSYTSSLYQVSPDIFSDVDSRMVSVGTIEAISNVVKDYDIIDFDQVDVKDYNALSNAVVTNVECPIEKYSYDKGVTYAVSDVQFNDEENYASFNTRNNIQYKHLHYQSTYGIVGIDKDGLPKYGLVQRLVTEYSKFVQDNTIYVKADGVEELEQWKSDTTLVFDRFIEVANKKDKSHYIIDSTSVTNENEYNIGYLDHLM